MSRVPAHEVLPVFDLGLHDPEVIHRAQLDDTFLSSVISAMKNDTPPPGLTQQAGKLFFNNNVLYRTYNSPTGTVVTQILVPKSLQSYILAQLHDKGGHLGVTKTLAKVKERFYWQGYEVDVEEWVKRCEACQRRNSPNITPRAHNYCESSI